jgi:D-alanyl-lipoteichoic acid acyltransferase DltB (MBOAT superfamily)
MLFNSFEFLLFLPVVYILYWFIFNRSLPIQNGLLLVSSYFFYGWWSWQFMGLLMLSTLIDYFYGFGVASTNKKQSKLFLILSIINNLGILAVFKYYNFFITQFKEAMALLHIGVHPILIEVALPVGISFYTFHGMSYVIDIYNGKQKPVRNFVDYAVFVSFFPLLVAGPIERASHLLPQIQIKRSFNLAQSISGIRQIIWGMFKKVVVADTLATTVDLMFEQHTEYNGISLLVGAILFSFQIYGDFSGYSDIALGTAKLFGFELLSNFKFPYFSRDIAEFWRRWHISLSSWFRDYVYIPLGGSKLGKSKAVRNTLIIFLISGFWHGASWNFIVWGAIHAMGFLPLLLLNKNRLNTHEVVANNRMLPNRIEWWQMIKTFSFVTFAWIFFRAKTLPLAVDYIVRIVHDIALHPAQLLQAPSGLKALLFVIPMVLGDWMFRRNDRNYPINKWVGLILALIAMLYLLAAFGKKADFIYFQF